MPSKTVQIQDSVDGEMRPDEIPGNDPWRVFMEDPTAMVMTQEWFQACPADKRWLPPQITSLPIKFFTQYKKPGQGWEEK